jgi:acyl-CoA reductase-like NAD-dependent aldehyde dehydrogenase
LEERRELFIAGEWKAPRTGGHFEVISPYTEQPIAAVAAGGPGDVDDAVEAARRAQDEGPWPRLDPRERVARVRRIAELYQPRKREIAQLITAEMGAPISFSKFSQATLPMVMLGAFADLASVYPWEEVRPGFYGQDVIVRREPGGVVAAIAPWNVPLFLVVNKLAPALLAGCSIVVKPASQTPLDSLVLAEIIEAADLPPGVVSILPGNATIGEALYNHPGVDRVSFTGSTAVGRRIAAACGAGLKKVSLELGGKSAAVVLDDADAATVAEGVKMAGLMNNGEACVAQTRILVPAARHDAFLDALAAMVEGLAVGDPADAVTDIGPLATDAQRAQVRSYIESGQSEGARLVVGGSDSPAGIERGWFVRPTLFADVDNGMKIAREEIFGPVLTVIPYRDDDDAVRIANDSDYGLSGSVWTADPMRGLEVARRVRSGSFGVNQPYSMDPAAPFGGVKASGIGRELGREGLDAYTDLKAISGAPPTASAVPAE